MGKHTVSTLSYERDDTHLSALTMRMIDAFISVAQTKSVQLGARQLGEKESTISTRIKSLEELLRLEKGESLFKRQGAREKTSLELSTIGEICYENCLGLRHQMAATLRGVAMARLQSTPIRIGIQNSINRVISTQIIHNLTKQRIGTDITQSPSIAFSVHRPERLIADLESGVVDMIISKVPTWIADGSKKDLECEILYQEEIVLVSSASDRTTLDTILNEREHLNCRSRFINIDWGSDYDKHIKAVFGPRNLDFDYSFDRSTAALNLILNYDGDTRNHCAAYFPMRVISKYLHADSEKKLYLVDENGHPLKRNVHLVTQKRAFHQSTAQSARSNEKLTHYKNAVTLITKAIQEASTDLWLHLPKSVKERLEQPHFPERKVGRIARQPDGNVLQDLS